MNFRTMLGRLVTLLFALALVATACGSDDPPNDETTAEPTDTQSEPAAADDPEDPDDDTSESVSGLPDLGGREITVAVTNAYLPFSYIDAATGEPGGWDYAAMDEICERLNCTYTVETFDFDPTIQAVADGQFDMSANGITITDARAQVVDFSDGYINIDQRILVHKEETVVDGPQSLTDADCLVGSQTGTTNFETAVTLVGEGRIQAFDDFGTAVAALLSRDVCAIVIDETAGQGYVGRNAEDLELVGESLSSDQLGLVFGQGSDLVEPFNAALNEMRADGTLERLAAEFFSGSFTLTYDDIEG